MAAMETVAVIGVGVMGRGIAHAAAVAGYRTILEDILPATLRKAGDEIRGALDQAVEAGQLSPAYLGCKRAPPTGAMVKPGAEKSPGSNRS